MRVRATDGTPEKVGSSRTITKPTWSTDGSEIYYCNHEEAGYSTGDRRIWVVRVADGVERPLTDFENRRGSLMPFIVATDGTYLYFGWRDDLADIWVAKR